MFSDVRKLKTFSSSSSALTEISEESSPSSRKQVAPEGNAARYEGGVCDVGTTQ